ncbi:glucosamine 6-phosphate N-acetyltransferase-like [Paramacrobiotus metropolitanus]|uniref:glucosamine 6-phosphate N-acetyltransferase-like n=1 Tax=Paramacrobiotus metropolitanus TaxID=2943436 RepID=UPI00244651F8|nr:glucosamine 6-phosphate N-acetyltransferase-like [Paramacrobiotus metropolitanus]
MTPARAPAAETGLSTSTEADKSPATTKNHLANGSSGCCADSVDNDVELFDSKILFDLDFSNPASDYRGMDLCPKTPGKGLRMRALRRGDFQRGYVGLLGQLAHVGEVTERMYKDRFDGMRNCPNTYYTIVLEDEVHHKIVGAATLVVEQKFIHSAALRGRIEDVVVLEDRRGQDLGKLLMDTATLLSKTLGCYKVSLECKDKLVGFYRQFGYQVDLGNNYMIQRFRN